MPSTTAHTRVLSGAINSPAGIIIIWSEDVAYCKQQILLDTWGIVGDWGGRPLAPGWTAGCSSGPVPGAGPGGRAFPAEAPTGGSHSGPGAQCLAGVPLGQPPVAGGRKALPGVGRCSHTQQGSCHCFPLPAGGAGERRGAMGARLALELWPQPCPLCSWNRG